MYRNMQIIVYICIMRKALKEITKLSDKDCLYIVERHKSEFLFPLHTHKDFELNFVENGQGVQRIIGDSVETIGKYDLTLVAGEGLEHAWEQGNCTEPDIREITIQFSSELLGENILSRNQFASIKRMFERASLGLNFSQETIMRTYYILDNLASMGDHFDQFLSFMKMMYILSQDTEARELSTSSYAQAAEGDPESRRIAKVKDYVGKHYAEELRLEDLASLAGMSPTAFSRFFKQHSGRSLMDYIIDIRLGNAARLLIDTTESISEICYKCGFNNLSNFNRTFKNRRGYTPRDFRTLFRKNRVVV